jgi:biotin carboxyl carrier protein
MEILPEPLLRMRRALETLTLDGRQPLTAPLPGRVLQVLVKQGDQVTRGQPLLVLEALRMENQLRSPRAGTVVELRVQAGQDVDGGAVLLAVE